MINKLLRKFMRLPVIPKLHLLFYPIFIVLRLPYEFLLGTRYFILSLNRDSFKSLGFYPENACNNLFYHTEWLNLRRTGRGGVSSIVGLGEYPLSSWFFLSNISLGLFANAGAMVTYFGTIFWILGFMFWWPNTDVSGLCLTIFLLTLSVHTYAMAFVRQNYQIVSWVFAGPLIYFAEPGRELIFFLLVILVAETGITAYVLCLPVVLFLGIEAQAYGLIMLYLLGCAPIIWRMKYLIRSNQFKKTIIQIISLIGAKQKRVRYSRNLKKWELPTLYFFSLYSFAFFAFTFVSGQVQYLIFIGACCYFLNQKIMRIADEESLMMFNVTLATHTILTLEQSYLNIVIFWFIVNPPPFLLAVQVFDFEKGLGQIRRPKLIKQHNFVESVSTLIQSVRNGEKIMCAFPDPIGQYQNLFLGYRIIHEVTLNAAAKNNIHCLPDWWGVSETNYEGAPSLWGISSDNLKKNCERWQCKYAIVYDPEILVKDSGFLKDFEIIGSFDWGFANREFPSHNLWPKHMNTPIVTLMKLSKYSS